MEEYDFQTRVTTRQEIRKLVNSKEYQRMMALKGGADTGKWNWQVADKQEGFFPMGSDEGEENKSPELNGYGITEEEF